MLYCRCIPILRSLISIPAGMAGMRFVPFLVLTTAGSTAWNLLLVGLGALAGENWPVIIGALAQVSDAVKWILPRRRWALCFFARFENAELTQHALPGYNKAERRESNMEEMSARSALLLGWPAVEKLAACHVAVFGVAAWAATRWKPWPGAAWGISRCLTATR